MKKHHPKDRGERRLLKLKKDYSHGVRREVNSKDEDQDLQGLEDTKVNHKGSD